MEHPYSIVTFPETGGVVVTHSFQSRDAALQWAYAWEAKQHTPAVWNLVPGHPTVTVQPAPVEA